MDSQSSSVCESSSGTKPLSPLLVEDDRPIKKKTPPVSKYTGLRQRWPWKQAFIAAKDDILALNWLSAIWWIFVFAWVSGLCVLIGLLAADPFNMSESRNSACQPDGTFNIFVGDYSSWQASGFFQITMAWGTFPFTEAKVIDVAWDIVVGRGGQTLLAWISWNVFSDYVTTSMEVSPITYETFWTVFLQGQPSAYSTWFLIRDFTRSHGLRSRFAMVFMVLVPVFVLAFPTLIGAMSGYSARTVAYVNSYDDEMLKFGDFDVVAYTIHDGWRVNLTGDYAVTYRRDVHKSEQRLKDTGDNYFVPTAWDRYWNPTCAAEPYGTTSMKGWEGENPMNSRCSIHRNVSNYVQEHGFFGLSDRESTWMNQSLPAPTLNISAYYIPSINDKSLFGRNWTDPRTNSQPFLDKDKLKYWYGPRNQTYDLTYIRGHGVCQPTTERVAGSESIREIYQWGFSFFQLFVMVILLLLWTVGTLLMSIKARMTMKTRGRSDKPRGFKGVLELAAAMRRELQETNPDDLSEEQLGKEIKKHLKGGSIALETTDSPEMYGLLKGFWGWVKERKVSAGLFVLFIVAGSTFATIRWYSSWPFVPAASLLVAAVVGRSRPSRVVFAWSGILLGTGIFLAVQVPKAEYWWYHHRKSSW